MVQKSSDKGVLIAKQVCLWKPSLSLSLSLSLARSLARSLSRSINHSHAHTRQPTPTRKPSHTQPTTEPPTHTPKHLLPHTEHLLGKLSLYTDFLHFVFVYFHTLFLLIFTQNTYMANPPFGAAGYAGLTQLLYRKQKDLMF
jgi:hypothetical protein